MTYLLENIAKRIRSQPTLTWIEIALKIGIDVNDIDKIKKKENTALEFVSTITNKLWKEIFTYLDISSTCGEYVEITNIDKLVQIFAGKSKSDDIDGKSNIDILKEIACRVADWKRFARILGLQESYINDIERNFFSPDMYIQRNLEVMKQLSRPLPATTSWEFWRQYLNQFENGKIVITEIEETFPNLLAKVDAGVHKFSNDKIKYIGHPFYYKHQQITFNGDYSNNENRNPEIAVRLGNGGIVDFQSLSQWMDTQQQYSDRYTVLQEINSFNYVNVGNNNCPILKTLTKYLDNTNDSGFVVKGYHFVNHICLFKPGLFAKDLFDDHYFCFVASDGVALYVTVCSQDKGRALHRSTRNIQIANLLHKELNSTQISQINVIIFNDDEDIEFCKTCIDNQLYVSKKVFQDYEKFLSWYKNVFHIMKLKHQSKTNAKLKEMNDISQSVKKDMFTYEALENTSLPSFSYCKEDQVDELKKIVVFTLPQMNILYSNANHIVIRGSYGCGKSVVLEKRFEKVIVNIDPVDITYLMCHDQQSEYYRNMKRIRSKYSEKNIIVCQSNQIVPSFTIPKLSTILKNIKCFWPNKRIHLFIDEFSGSYFDKREVLKLKEVLNAFEKCHVVIALQSMEENVNTQESVDVGYQLDYLCESTSFVVYNLQHTLRCSYEINEFVKATVRIVECSNISVGVSENFNSYGKFVDKEFGNEYINSSSEKEKATEKTDEYKSFIETSYKYNLSDVTSHTVKSGPVKVYFLDKHLLKSVKVNNKSIVYMSVVSHILTNVSSLDKYVVCTYNKDLYNAAAGFFESKSFNWTNEISEFIKSNSNYEVLLTDYASVRGFEFPNFIFMAPLGSTFLRYRFIECLTRGTTNLYVITDNVKIKKELFSKNPLHEVDLKLLNEWRECDCSLFYEIKYDRFKKVLKIMGDGEAAILKEDFRGVDCGSFEKFPWVDGVSLQDMENENDTVSAVMRSLIIVDNVELLNEFLDSNNIDLLFYDNVWKTNLLEFAIKHNALQILKVLVNKYEFEIDILASMHTNLLELAISQKNANLLEFIFNKNKKRPNHLTSRSYGNHNIVEMLLAKNPDVNAKNHLGRTALHDAVCNGYTNLVKVLIGIGADVNIFNLYSNTPLYAAIHYKHVDIVKILLDKYVISIDKCNNFGNTLLHCACSKGLTDIVNILLDKNADVNVKNLAGNTPLHSCCNGNHIEVVKVFLQRGNMNCMAQNSAGNTPLHIACRNGHFDIVQIFVEKCKLNLDIQNNEGNTPLHVACIIEHNDIVNLLINENADCNLKNNYGNIAFHYFKMNFPKNIVEKINMKKDKDYTDR